MAVVRCLREAARPPLGLRHAVAAPGAQRLPGVVRHLARPHEIPERGERRLGLEAGGGEQVEPELGALRQRAADRVVRLALRRRRAADAPEHRRVLAEIECDAVDPGADPDDLAGGAQLVELLGPVARDAAREHLGLPQRDRKRKRLERDERLAQRRPPVDPVPARQEAADRRLLDRLDLLAQRGERRAPQPAEHVGVAPLALGAARTELAADELVLALERAQLRLDVAAEVLVRLAGRERAARAGEAGDQRPQRLVPALQERLREAGRRHRAERVAIPAGVLGGDQALFAGNSNECSSSISN